MKTNFELVKDRPIVMENADMTTYKIFPTVKDFVDFLNLPVEEIDEDEKRYLKNIVRPFRDSVIDIHKRRYDDKYEYLVIVYKDTEDEMRRRMYLPNFKKDTMYKGMLLDKEYTLEELGITFKN